MHMLDDKKANDPPFVQTLNRLQKPHPPTCFAHAGTLASNAALMPMTHRQAVVQMDIVLGW